MDATLEKDGHRYVLMVERRLAHPPERVWQVVTDRELVRQWFPCEIEGEWRVGAPLRFHFLQGEGEGLPDEDLRGEVVAIDEPWLLEYRWGSHFLKYEIESDGDGCRFRLFESFEDPSWGARNAAGWEMCLENLDLILEGAAAAKFAAEVWKTKFRRYVAKFEPAFGAQDDPSGKHALLPEEEPKEPT